jgi:predicted RecB family nuclease
LRKVGESFRLSASDLVGYLNCRHLTQLDRAVANGERSKPHVWDPMLEVLRERGFRHEQAYIDHLAASGLSIITLEDGDISDAAVAATREAMSAGPDVIVQAALKTKGWAGRADVLRKVDAPSNLGEWSYEVVDTKLARETKAGTVLQLCLYSHLVADVQGVTPEFMYVVPPWRDFVPERWRVADVAAYYRRVKAGLEDAVVLNPDTELYPEPAAHCDVCRWRNVCAEQRRDDDHLSLVAGISKLQINELKEHGVTTVAGLAEMPLPIEWKPDRGTASSYERVREQARVQVEGRVSGELKYELLPFVEGFGLECLPQPSEGDIFLDFEGDPFVGENGLEYLTGYHFLDEDGTWAYRGDWALDREQEKRAFQDFIDFVVERQEKYPDLHVFHYGGYEAGALKRLMGRYATRESEVDNLLRGKVLVDLLAIVRHSLRASVESYSIKSLEPFFGYRRATDLPDANLALRHVETSLELNEGKELDPEHREVVRSYNEDDCIATRWLRDWLEKLREDAIAAGAEIPRPAPAAGEPSEDLSERLERIAALGDALTGDLPADATDRNEEQQARYILAHLLEWHRREAKAVWWEYFRLSALSGEDLLDERAGLSGLTFVETVGGTAQCPIDRYSYPPQEADVSPGKPLKQVGGEGIGTVAEIAMEQLTIDIKKTKKAAALHPEAVFVHEHIRTTPMEDALIRLAEYVVAHGVEGQGPHQAERDLLLRRSPVLRDGKPLRLEDELAVDAAKRIARTMDAATLPIQGPPGAGKTFTGARMICELVRQGKKVGIVANSHAVIRNLLDEVVRAAEEQKLDLKCIQKPKEMELGTDRIQFARDASGVFDALNLDCQVAAGTAWLWASQAAFQSVDTLFVDEAAQMSLANVLAVAQAGRSLVLLGDPQQLDQPMQGSHPEGTDSSALDHVLNGGQTLGSKQGLFLEETWRLHPDICTFTSELFYEGKLQSRPGLEAQGVGAEAGIGVSGLRFLPVPHHGNQNCSPEEAAVVAELVSSILSSGAMWTDSKGVQRPISDKDILIIAPYNAQVAEIQRRLPGARVGTVDKFQGQEAPIAIYSLATSTYADAPRGMEFLYSLNRLNVATSRAKCVSILVASPAVFQAECKTPRQIQLANAFCRYLELAA